MVGTAQADNFSIFIRKIGFSVGVESILRRANEFGESYASVASFREADWSTLVHVKWNLKSSNVSDVFGALDIAKVSNHEVYAGPVGEALGIVHKLLAGEELARAIRFLVCSAIVRADGDIFLNALRAGFVGETTSKALVEMIYGKREALYLCFLGPRDREAIAKVVSIERQRTNKGSSSAGGLSGLVRSTPLGGRSDGLGLPSAIDIHAVDDPSQDYIRKITTSRRGWAESLGLFAGGSRTAEGDRFLLGLGDSGFARPSGVFVVWPTTFELEANLFRPSSFHGLGLRSTWEFQLAIYRALGGRVSLDPPDLEAVARQIRVMYRGYRDLSQHRSMIRNEVSSHVFFLVALAVAIGKDEAVPDLDAALRSDLLQYGIHTRPSKTIELAITVRSDANQAAQ